MTVAAYISNWAWVPEALLGKSPKIIKNRCTVYPKAFGNEEPVPIKVYDDRVPGYLGLPIDWALQTFPNLGFEDRTTSGAACYYHTLPDPTHPRAAPGQAEFMNDLDTAVGDYHTVLAKAATGSGKTVVALRTAAMRGRRTAIVVHLQRLARQWANEIHDKLGIPYDEIGWVQGDVCNWDKPFVVCVMKSLAERVYPKEFYDSIGTVVFDECHRLGAPLFAKTIGLFRAEAKIFLTATDKRRDGCDKVFHHYAGQPKVIAKQPAMHATVHSITYNGAPPRWMSNSGQLAVKLGEDHRRNDLLTRIICSMHKRGRNILVIGDRVEHLQTLALACQANGVPPTAIGMFVDQLYTDHLRQTFKKVKATDEPTEVVYWGPEEKGEQPLFEKHTPLTVLRCVGGGEFEVRPSEFYARPEPYLVTHNEVRYLPVNVPVMIKQSQDELDRILAHSTVTFATYGMMREGIDKAAFDAGIDVTPRVDGEQVIGRVRRPLPGKPEPVWYTIHDRNHETLDRWWRLRVRDYRQCNCTVVEHGTI